MDYKRISAIFFILISQLSTAQSSIDDALLLIEKNNKMIVSAIQYVKAKGLDYHTGLTPENPFISADYMIGKPVAGGNQFDFQVTQAFDFPTAYGRKKILANNQEELLKIQLDEIVQNTLFDAKVLGLEIIYLNRQKQVLDERISQSETLLANYQHKFELNEITALTLNRAKLQLLQIQTQMRKVKSQIKIKNDHLIEMNGGEEISITATEYPIYNAVPSFDDIHDSIEANDPNLKLLEHQITIHQSEVRLAKSMSLPKLEAGYHYQSVLGQTFNGAHVGISIPLWQQKNTIKAEESFVQHASLQFEEHKLEHFYGIREQYEDYENMKQTLEAYQEVLEGINSEALLLKSLELGEISYITYSLDIQYYYTAYDQLLEIENNYHQAVAQLFKYQL